MKRLKRLLSGGETNLVYAPIIRYFIEPLQGLCH
jgi:hypothetical protein